MRIAIVVPTLRIGGAEAAATRLANQLSNNWAEVTLIVLIGENDKASSPLKVNINQNVTVKHLNSSTMLRSILKLRHILKYGNFDIVQSMIRGSNYALVLSSYGIKSYSIVLREANVIILPTDSLIKKLLRVFMLNILYRFSDAIVCNCRVASLSLAKFIINFNKPILTLPNPVVSNQYFKKNFISNIHNRRQRNRVLCVARHSPQKDISILIKAFRELQKIRPNTYLIIIGDGPLLEFNRSLAKKLNINKKVEFILQASPLSEFYLTSDTFVLPSKWEGTPNSMVEALIFGMKVVSFESFGCTSIITRLGHGRVVQQRKSTDLATAIAHSLDSNFPNQKERFDGLKQFEASFAAENFIKLYKSLRKS